MRKTVISVLSVVKMGVWKIPQRAQGFINNYYASLKKQKISFQVSEEMFFDNFFSLKESLKNYKSKDIIIIFCSTLQLSKVNNINEFVKFFSKYEIHFSIELINGKGKLFLNDIFNQNKKFLTKKIISLENNKSYYDLYNSYKNKII